MSKSHPDAAGANGGAQSLSAGAKGSAKGGEGPGEGTVAGTAYLVNVFRMRENNFASDRRQYVDPYARLFVDDASLALAERFEAENWELTFSIRVRTSFYDRALRAAISAGVRQVIILGSGMDARALRFWRPQGGDRPACRFFEVDLPHVLQHKRAVLDGQGIHLRSTFVEGNYLEMDLHKRLQDAGVACDEPICFILEGNTQFLRAEDLAGLLRLLADRFADARLITDYLDPKVIDGTTGNADMDALRILMRDIYSPWINGISCTEPLAAYLQSIGAAWEVVEERSVTDAAREYYGDEVALTNGSNDWYNLAVLSNRRRAS